MDLSQTTKTAIQKHQPLQRKTEFCQRTASGLELRLPTSPPAELNSPHSTIPCVNSPNQEKENSEQDRHRDTHQNLSPGQPTLYDTPSQNKQTSKPTKTEGLRHMGKGEVVKDTQH